jgi:glycerophosphoryl diester phosphodiesterase
MGADYLEQDLVMTKDDQLVVMHDHFLDGITDVAERFPAGPPGRSLLWWISPWTRCAPCA